MNLIWRLMAEAWLVVWLWVRIAARRITINVNWQYLVSGSSLLTAAWRWTSHPGSGIPGVELNNNVIKAHQVQDQVGTKSFNKPGNFWDRSKTYQFVKLERYFATDRFIYPRRRGLVWAQRAPGYRNTGNGTSIRAELRSGNQMSNNVEILLLLVTSFEQYLFFLGSNVYQIIYLAFGQFML